MGDRTTSQGGWGTQLFPAPLCLLRQKLYWIAWRSHGHQWSAGYGGGGRLADRIWVMAKDLAQLAVQAFPQGHQRHLQGILSRLPQVRPIQKLQLDGRSHPITLRHLLHDTWWGQAKEKAANAWNIWGIVKWQEVSKEECYHWRQYFQEGLINQRGTNRI